VVERGTGADLHGGHGSLAIGAGLAALSLQMTCSCSCRSSAGCSSSSPVGADTVVSYRVFGRRVFLMAPLHHHFELLGWPETTVIVRFWILAVCSPRSGSACSMPTSCRSPTW